MNALNINRSKLMSITGILFSLCFVTACSSEAKMTSGEGVFEVSSGGTLNLDSDHGSVKILTHNSDSVHVLIEKGGNNAEDFEVIVTQDGANVDIKGERTSGIGWNGPKVKFTITTPKHYNLDLQTGGGSIRIDDLTGSVNAKTSGGSIGIGEIVGDVDIKTSGGSISVDKVVGTINGHTSGGSIKVTIAQQPKYDSKLTTSGGSITAYLIDDIAVDLYARTSGGRVRSEFAVKGRTKKTSIKGSINGGGPDLVLKTSGGSVKIKRID